MARKPKTPSPPPPPSITEQVESRLSKYKTLAITLTVLGVFVGGLWSGLVRFGIDPVGSGTLAAAQTEITRKVAEADAAIRTEIGTKIGEALLPLRTELAELKQEVTQRKRELLRFQIENLEAQDAQITWSQLPQLINNVAGIERQLQERPGDTWLLQRKSEIESAKKNIEGRLDQIRSRLKVLRDQQ